MSIKNRISLILIILLITAVNVSASGLTIGSIRTNVEQDEGVNSYTMYSLPPEVIQDKLLISWYDDYWREQVVLVSTDGTVNPVPAVTISPKTNDNSDTIIYRGLSNGNILVYWYSGSSGTGLTDTYFKIINQTGTVLVGTTKINSAAGELNRFTDFAELSNGNLAFIWATGGGNYALRRFRPNGTALDASQLSITSLAGISGSQYSHNIAAHPNGSFMIMLSYYNYDYRGMVFNNDSPTPIQVNGQNSFVISSRGENGNQVQYVKTLTSGKFLTVYQKIPTGNTNNRSIAYRIYNEDGTPYANEKIIRQVHSWGWIYEPIVVNDGFLLFYFYNNLQVLNDTLK